jgi:hypothetical protein
MQSMLLNLRPKKFFFDASRYTINADKYYLVTHIEQLLGFDNYSIILLPDYQYAGFLQDHNNMDQFRYICSTAKEVIYVKQS